MLVETTAGSDRAIVHLDFNEDGTMLVTTDLWTTGTQAWDEQLDLVWSRPDSVRLEDDVVWDHEAEAGAFVGFPVAVDDFVDYARSMPTRSLTEEECRIYFDLSCAGLQESLDAV